MVGSPAKSRERVAMPAHRTVSKAVGVAEKWVEKRRLDDALEEGAGRDFSGFRPGRCDPAGASKGDRDVKRVG
jgi:hypothetical protein